MKTVIRAVVATLLMFGFGPLAAQDKHIDVIVVNAGSGDKLDFDNSECPERPFDRGCITAEHGSSPNITWQLPQDSGYVFTRLQFSPDGNSWGDPSRPLQNCTVEDFALSDADRYSGNASTARVLGGGKMLMIRDYNRNACITHYRIYAMPENGGAEIDSDPIIDNRGGNN